jgi:ketosteroid isomerase-like protein
MNEALIEVAARDVLSVLTHLGNGNIEDAVADFAETFCFNDRGLGLEFTEREQLREFFQKERELYPGSSFQTKKIHVTEDHVIAEWLLEYTVREPFYGNVLRDVPVSLEGVSVVQARKGKITEWSDYYDGLTSRRTALASCFTEWIED